MAQRKFENMYRPTKVHFVLLDNNVLTNLRCQKIKGKPKEKFVRLVKNYIPNLDSVKINIFQFLEVIEKGQLLTNVIKEESRDKIKEIVLDNYLTKEKKIFNIDEYLLNCFKQYLIKALSQEKIFEMALNRLEEYPFHKSFNILKEKILAFSKRLSENKTFWEFNIDFLARYATSKYMYFLIKNIKFSEAEINMKLVFNFSDIFKYLNDKDDPVSNLVNLTLDLLTDFEEDFPGLKNSIKKDGDMLDLDIVGYLFRNFPDYIFKTIFRDYRPAYTCVGEEDLFEHLRNVFDSMLTVFIGVYPVTILTLDPIEEIKKRLDVYAKNTLLIFERIKSFNINNKNYIEFRDKIGLLNKIIVIHKESYEISTFKIKKINDEFLIEQIDND